MRVLDTLTLQCTDDIPAVLNTLHSIEDFLQWMIFPHCWTPCNVLIVSLQCTDEIRHSATVLNMNILILPGWYYGPSVQWGLVNVRYTFHNNLLRLKTKVFQPFVDIDIVCIKHINRFQTTNWSSFGNIFISSWRVFPISVVYHTQPVQAEGRTKIWNMKRSTKWNEEQNKDPKLPDRGVVG